MQDIACAIGSLAATLAVAWIAAPRLAVALARLALRLAAPVAAIIVAIVGTLGAFASSVPSAPAIAGALYAFVAAVGYLAWRLKPKSEGGAHRLVERRRADGAVAGPGARTPEE